MHNVHVSITTIPERTARLKRLLSLLRQQRGVRLDIHVHVDGPRADEIMPLLNGGDAIFETTRRLGKDGYWRLVNQAICAATQRRSELTHRVQQSEWEYVFFVQDDITFEENDLLASACSALDFLRHQIPAVTTFNLHGDGPDWQRTGRWTGRPVVETAYDVVYAHWVDMRAVLFTPLAFQAVPVLHPIERENHNFTSSGVGRQLSLRFDRANTAQLMVPEPEVTHADGGTSHMNPEETEKRKESILEDPDIPDGYAD